MPLVSGKKRGNSQVNTLIIVSGNCIPTRNGRNLPIRVRVLSTITDINVSFITSHTVAAIFITALTVKSIFTTSHIYRSEKSFILNVFDQSFIR